MKYFYKAFISFSANSAVNYYNLTSLKIQIKQGVDFLTWIIIYVEIINNY